MELETVTQPTYILGHSSRELDRLSTQAALFEPLTRDLFRAAGIRPGMRVLDVGCGSGDVAFLAAEFVGPNGQVVGIDRSLEAVARAEERTTTRGLRNVSWIEGDPTELEFDEPFDAILGRLVLMYYANPATSLAKLRRSLRVGGLMIFQELDPGTCRSFPVCPLYQTCIDLICRTLQISGARPQLGMELHSLFGAAGFPNPRLLTGGFIAGGSDDSVCKHLAEVVKSLVPAMEKFGVASEEELNVETLAHRLQGEIVTKGAVVTSPSLIGAWSRRES